MKTRSKLWWEKFWSNKSHDFGNKANPKLLKFAKGLIKGKKNLTALDLASGNGRYAIALAKLGYKVDAIEISNSGVKRILENAKNENVKVNAKQGNMVKLNLKNKKYDLIFCVGGLEELNKKYRERLLNKIVNWTKQGGINVIKYCLEINTRGKLIEEGFVRKFYQDKDYNILFSEEEKKLTSAKAHLDVPEKIRTGTIITKKHY